MSSVTLTPLTQTLSMTSTTSYRYCPRTSRFLLVLILCRTFFFFFTFLSRYLSFSLFSDSTHSAQCKQTPFSRLYEAMSQRGMSSCENRELDFSLSFVGITSIVACVPQTAAMRDSTMSLPETMTTWKVGIDEKRKSERLLTIMEEGVNY